MSLGGMDTPQINWASQVREVPSQVGCGRESVVMSGLRVQGQAMADEHHKINSDLKIQTGFSKRLQCVDPLGLLQPCDLYQEESLNHRSSQEGKDRNGLAHLLGEALLNSSQDNSAPH